MSDTPIVIAREQLAEDTAQWRLRVPSDCKFFNGHFDGNPILPGVTQVHWAVAFASELQVGEFTGLPQVKFMQPILPEAEISLRIKHLGKKLQFEYFDDANTYSAGTVTVC
ncbi:ApeI family dehydratase [Salinibius halmophilus]|uniref:ApeI family dehydratase n=1 Tax=Salinibius halmophilus TaxID=1853216 RepID=UPI000E6728F3|nr:hydroxymyristoyl-ACP dehydratase [Salinibius halmophilus]